MENLIITQFMTLGTATQTLILLLAILGLYRHFTTKFTEARNQSKKHKEEQEQMEENFNTDLGEVKQEIQSVKASVEILSNTVHTVAERQKEQDRNITKILTLLIEDKRK